MEKQESTSPNAIAVRAFVLAKNEQANIARSLGALSTLGIPTTVLDSGSSDATAQIAAEVPDVCVEPFVYCDHCTSYNQITLRISPEQYALVLDADMVVTSQLWAEICDILTQQAVAAIVCPIEMWWEGRPLAGGSLCPPKAIVLKGGVEHYVASGHGERLLKNGLHVTTRHRLIHDDRKGFEAYIQSQLRYTKNLVDRAERGQVTAKDKVYLYTPLILLFQPLYSYVFRGGFRSGIAGIVYSLDRVIASAIVLRQSLARRLSRDSGKPR